jgi:hypothetical protein
MMVLPTEPDLDQKCTKLRPTLVLRSIMALNQRLIAETHNHCEVISAHDLHMAHTAVGCVLQPATACTHQYYRPFLLLSFVGRTSALSWTDWLYKSPSFS